MSNILHFYGLSALDYLNTAVFPNMAPWTPTYTKADMIGTLSGTTSLVVPIVLEYIEGLKMRRKMHTAGALFSGRQPIQNALVPGGVTTLFNSTYPVTPTSTSIDQFGPFNAGDTVIRYRSLLNEVRTFINTKYIPTVLFVATNYSGYFNMGTGYKKLLSYGEYHMDTSGTLAVKRGIADGLTSLAFNQNNIVEFVNYSYYDYAASGLETSLHPFAGRTDPHYGKSGAYSWLKAPRYMMNGSVWPLEVGPLARVVNTHIRGGGPTVTQVAAQGTVTPLNCLGTNVGTASYNVSNLVAGALATAGISAGQLFSALGRHAARALEAKYVADACDVWVGMLTPNAAAYTYTPIPKQIKAGFGLAEAPRGALGHWIKIEGKKVAKYQCVVPTTWNLCPKDGLNQHGPIEEALIGSAIGTDSGDAIVNLLRLIHPYDICVACAVHVVTPEGKDVVKFEIGPDGKATKCS